MQHVAALYAIHITAIKPKGIKSSWKVTCLWASLRYMSYPVSAVWYEDLASSGSKLRKQLTTLCTSDRPNAAAAVPESENIKKDHLSNTHKNKLNEVG